METPKDLRFTKTHEWVRVEGEIATVGITDFAQSQLSDLTYVELPAIDDELAAQDEVAVVESVKAASDIYAPIGGTVTAVNEGLSDKPEHINTAPYTDGWLFKLKIADPAEVDALLTAEQYDEVVPDEE